MTTETLSSEPRRFEPDGPAAILQRALGPSWPSWREAARVRADRGPDGWAKPYGMAGDVAVVSVDGPLMQRGGWFWDGYDAIVERTREAFAEPKARAVMLKLNSPGGIAAGCFEASRQLRAMAQASGKPLIAYADEMACSAAYALACGASKIFLPSSGEIGSVGVLSAVVSMKRGLEKAGVDVEVIRSGKAKASGHPYDPMSDEAVAREQATVDALAAQFYALVAAARGMPADAVAALEGDTRLGAAAVAAGLADGVLTFDEAVRAASTTPASAPSTTHRGFTTMSEKMTAAVLALAGTTDEDAALGKVTAWKEGAARVAGLESELATLRTAKAAGEREALIQRALDDRKITPAKAADIRAGKGFAGSLSTPQLEGYLAEQSAVVDPASRYQQPDQLPVAGAASEATLSDEEKRMAAQMKVSEADFLATKKAHLARS